MKTYFNFQLSGRQFLPLWLLFYAFCVVPYCFLLYKMQSLNNQSTANQPSPILFLSLFILLINALIFTMYFVKIIIKNIKLNETAIACNYKLSKYIGIILLGLFLSIITLGIYSPWFIRNINRFFINNSSFNNSPFSFQGKGGHLFLILTLGIIVPIILLSLITVNVINIDIKAQSIAFRYIYQIIVSLIMIPYIYLSYKWFINIKYKEYTVKWNTIFYSSIGKIAIEITLSLITIGLYSPMAFLRLYKYFTDRTEAISVDNTIICFGYDIDNKKDYLFIGKHILLTILSLGIYYPWAFSKIASLLFGKTYIQKTEL